MKLRNLNIEDVFIQDKEKIIDAINELEIIIDDNYNKTIEREICIEYNIHSRLGEPREYLVVYVNPEFSNNPYVFILKQENETKILVDTTTLETFRDLSDVYVRQEVNKTIAIGFKRLPQYAFLSQSQIQEARDLAQEYRPEE